MMRTFTVVLCFVLFHSILTADALAITQGPVATSRQKSASLPFGTLDPALGGVKGAHAGVSVAITRLGSGNDALVALRLRDKTVLKGHVASIDADSFVVTDNDSGLDRRIAYTQVARLHGVNLASGAQVQYGGGFKARVARVAALLLPVHQVHKNSMTAGEKTLLIGIIIGVLLAIVLAKTL